MQDGTTSKEAGEHGEQGEEQAVHLRNAMGGEQKKSRESTGKKFPLGAASTDRPPESLTGRVR